MILTDGRAESARQNFFRDRLRSAGGAVFAVIVAVMQCLSAVAQTPSNSQPMRGVVRAVHQAALSTELATPVAFIGAREGQRFVSAVPLPPVGRR